MRVNLAVEVFAEAEALPDLLNLLRCFAEGRHDWVADPVVIAAAERYLAGHAPQLASTYIELGRKGTVAASWSGTMRALSQGWLEIEHGGGGSLAKVAESAMRRYRRLVRVAALLDSDRMVPGQRTNAYEKADGCAVWAFWYTCWS